MYRGRIAGEQFAVTRHNLLQDRDFQGLDNDRDVLAGVYSKLWYPSRTPVATVFPGAAPAT